MRILVTGATGFVGNEIVRHLRDRGHSVSILVRDPTSPQADLLLGRFGALLHQGDILDPATLPAALDGAEGVLHLVGIISENGNQTFENVHTLGTQHLLAAVNQQRIRRFVHMSALGTRPGAASRYHRTKWAAEELVRASGLDFTIFRPSLIYGPGDHLVNLFSKIIRFSPVLPVMGTGSARFQPVSVEVVARAFVTALTEPRSIGRTLDLCGPDNLTFSQMLDQILKVLGRRRMKLRIPISIARVQAAILEFLFPHVLGKPSPLNRDQLLMLEEDNLGDPGPANELFGLQPAPFHLGIAQYLPSARERDSQDSL